MTELSLRRLNRLNRDPWQLVWIGVAGEAHEAGMVGIWFFSGWLVRAEIC